MRTRSQRLLSMVLALSMLLTFLPVSAFAEGTPPPYADLQTLNGSNGSNTYTDPVSGDTYTYSLSGTTATLTKFTGKHANVPERIEKKDGTSYTVTAIGEKAFATLNSKQTPIPNKDLESVILPGSIQTIGPRAFSDCTKLSSLTTWNQDTSIPNGITTIAEHTFEACTSLNCFNFPNSITSIELGAFAYCAELSKVVLPKGLTTIGNGAFGAAGLTNITIPKSLKKVDEYAFASAINTVTYTGTQAQWNKLINSEDGNSFDKASNTQLTDVAPANFYCAHTVTFDKNGHGDSEEEVVEYNHTTTPISKPTADGFTFKGWYTASEGGEKFVFENSPITKDETLYAHWEKEEKKPEQPGTQQPGTTTPTTPPESTDKPTDKPNKPNEPTTPEQPGTPEKPNEPTPPEVSAVEEDDTAAIGYAAAAVTAAFVGWGAYRIGSEVYLKYLLPKDVLLPQNRIQLAELLWEDAGRPAPADDAAYTDVDADDTDARQAARWAVENGLLTLPDTEKPEEFAPYRSVSYAKSARAWNKAQQLKENAAR